MKPFLLMCKKVKDTTGASIVIALVFFLICAVVGSAVLTAASVNSQVAATYKKSLQDNYTVSSAASLISDQLQSDVRLDWTWNGSSKPSLGPLPDESLAQQLWIACEKIGLWARSDDSWVPQGASISGIEIQGTKEMGMATVYADIVIDEDFNIVITLSLTEEAGVVSPYDLTVELQSIPFYNSRGQLVGVEWESPIISKKGSGTEVL